MSAATDHLKSVTKRLALFNRQIGEAEEQLDRLTARPADKGDAEEQPGEQRDVTILGSLPGVGRIVLATLLAEAWEGMQRRPRPALPVRRRTRYAALGQEPGRSHAARGHPAAQRRL